MLLVYLFETKPLTDAVASADPAQMELEVHGEPRSVTITSTGSAPLQIHAVTVRGADAAAFTILQETCGHAYLLHGESCSVGLQFLGQNEGHGELLVTDNAQDGPLVIELHAAAAQKATTPATPPSQEVTPAKPSPVTGPGPVVSASKLVARPSSLLFERTAVGTTSEQQLLILRVAGDSPVGIDSIATEPNEEFRIAVDGCSQKTLTTGQSCRLGVVFAPRVAGPRSAQLKVAPHRPTDPIQVALDGTGFLRPNLQIDPSPLVFQATPQGSRVESALRLTILQEMSSRFAAATVSGPNQHDFSIASDGCRGKALAPVSSCAIRIRFAPRGTGERAATLTLAAQDGSTVKALARVDLKGQGLGRSALVLEPPSLSFTAARLNAASPPQTVVVTKTGPGTLTIEKVMVSEGKNLLTDLASILGGGNPSPHFTASGNCTGKVLDEGNRCEIEIRFSPTAYGDHHGFLTVKPSGASPVISQLTGSGPSEPPGWCCVFQGQSGNLSAQTREECKRMKGRYYPPEQREIAQQQCVVIR